MRVTEWMMFYFMSTSYIIICKFVEKDDRVTCAVTNSSSLKLVWIEL